MIILRYAALALAFALAACTTGDFAKNLPLFQSKGEQALSAGIKNYEEANYKDALQDLQTALDAGLTKESEVKARKHLAFIHCVSGREKQCRDEFKKALEINPGFDLTAAEAGHPVWGPVFRNVKAKSKK